MLGKASILDLISLAYLINSLIHEVSTLNHEVSMSDISLFQTSANIEHTRGDPEICGKVPLFPYV